MSKSIQMRLFCSESLRSEGSNKLGDIPLVWPTTKARKGRWTKERCRSTWPGPLRLSLHRGSESLCTSRHTHLASCQDWGRMGGNVPWERSMSCWRIPYCNCDGLPTKKTAESIRIHRTKTTIVIFAPWLIWRAVTRGPTRMHQHWISKMEPKHVDSSPLRTHSGRITWLDSNTQLIWCLHHGTSTRWCPIVS